jgi:hypothetical protein
VKSGIMWQRVGCWWFRDSLSGLGSAVFCRFGTRWGHCDLSMATPRRDPLREGIEPAFAREGHVGLGHLGAGWAGHRKETASDAEVVATCQVGTTRSRFFSKHG